MMTTLTRDDLNDLGNRLVTALRLRPCDHTHRHSVRVLKAMSAGRQWREDALDELIGLGGGCDCEVMLNVVCVAETLT